MRLDNGLSPVDGPHSGTGIPTDAILTGAVLFNESFHFVPVFGRRYAGK